MTCDLIARTDLGQDEAEPDAARGDVPIFLARLLLGGAFVGEAALGTFEIGRDLAPDRLKLVVDQGGRKVEVVALVERVKQSALHFQPRG